MFIVCIHLLPFFILYPSNTPLTTGYNNCLSLHFDFMPASFASENVALASFPINRINKGRWMEEEHKILMQEYEKYGNNCMLIAKVLSTRTPTQIKKQPC